MEYALADWDAMFAVNTRATWLLAKAAYAALKASHGAIVAIASMSGSNAHANLGAYGPSKAALINLAESLYGDLHPLGLGVYLVNPGFVDTPLTQKNDFKMPALISAQAAARATLTGIAAGRFETHYPKRFTRWLKLPPRPSKRGPRKA